VIRGAAGRRGIALLLAVWLLAILAAIAGEFVVSTRVKAAAERNQRDGIAAAALAQAGYRAALAALAPEVDRLGLDAEGRLLLYRAGEAEGTPAEERDVPLGDGVYSWRLESEDGRFNINGPRSRQRLVALLAAAGLEPGAERDTIADSILDWTDDQAGHRLNGAEEDWYRAQDPPYSCKDAPFDLPAELLLVRGVKREYFEGGDVEGHTYGALRDLVTVCPVNFAPQLAPQALLDALGMARPQQQVPLAGERYFRVVASGRSGTGPERSVLAVVRRSSGNAGTAEYGLVYWLDNYVPAPAGGEAVR